MSKSIIFTKIQDVADRYRPVPSSTVMPEWYKKTQSYNTKSGKKELDDNFQTAASIKRCVPVFDALSAGYIIPTYCDLWIKKNNDGEIIYVTSNNINIEFHPIMQAPYHPRMNHHPYPKWKNPWGIKTPPGYSCLFIPPVHVGNGFFTIAEGIVDTDSYTAPVNFPFVLNDVNFEGLIPAGTPMAQVIPFKRDSWEMEIGNDINRYSTEEDMKSLSSIFYDRYRKLFWDRKEYK